MEPTGTSPIRSQHDIITLRNIDDKDFVFDYDRSRGNYPYTIKAGEIARFPRFLAVHAMKKLIDKILDAKKVKLNNEPARAELQEQIFVEEEVFQHSPQPSEAQRLRNEVESLNKPSDLESVLSRNASKAKAPDQPKLDQPVPEESKEEDATKFDGLEDEGKAKKAGMVGSTVDTTDEPAKAPVVKPDRLKVLKYAEDKLGLTLDKKTMEKLDKLSDDELIAEFQYPLD